MPASAHIAARAAVLLVAISLGACSSRGADDPVARVGDHPITRATVDHWASVLKGSLTLSGPSGRQHLALSLLISYQWLIAEAARRSIPISEREVRQQIDRILARTFPGGIPELREYLKPTGETVADLKLQARAQLALARLRATALAGVPAVSKNQVAAYYTHHRQSFVIPERREARFRNWKTRASALKVKREVEAGKSLTSPQQRKVGELFTGARVPPTNEYERAIDSGKLHKVAGPFSIGNDYWLYEVAKIIPARAQALARVAHSIARQLTNQRRREAVAAFVKTWTADWSARTDCRAGYVVQGCRQDRGDSSGKEGLPQI